MRVRSSLLLLALTAGAALPPGAQAQELPAPSAETVPAREPAGEAITDPAQVAAEIAAEEPPAEDEPAPLVIPAVDADLSEPNPDAPFWAGVPVRRFDLVAQPMFRPRPKETTTSVLEVQAVHDDLHWAFRLRWADPERSEAGRLGEYSDGAAIQVPMRPAEIPPPIFMGSAEAPVHILHWRAQYQRDNEVGKPTMKDLYPNMSVDMYPMEYHDPGSAAPSMASREQYSPGVAVGNPQSFPKTSVDEIYAEGFSTSSVQESVAVGHGDWQDGFWTLVIVRPLRREGASSFGPGDKTFAAFAVWQGGSGEVGARKSLTMRWTPVELARPAEGRAAATAPAAKEGGRP